MPSLPSQPKVHRDETPLAPWLYPYLVGVAAIFLAGAARWLLDPLLADRAPYITVLPAVILVGVRYGLMPAIWSLILGWFVIAVFFWSPRYSIELSMEHLRATGAYVLVGAVSLLLVQLLGDRASSGREQQLLGDHATEDLLDASARLQELLQSLTLSEERYRVLAEALPQFVWTLSARGEVDYCNQHWLDYSGLTLQETIASQWTKLIHADDLPTLQSALDDARQQRSEFLLEYRIRRASDGAYRWHLGRMTPLLDESGRPLKWVGSAIDIDDQKRAQNALLQQQEHFRLLAEAIPQIVWTADEQGQIDYFNRRWFDYTGLSLQQTFSSAGWMQAMHPDDLADFRQRWTDSVQSGRELQVEYRFRRASDGAYRWHLGRAVPLAIDEGVAHWFGTCTDIEDQKRAEASIRESEERFRVMADTAPVMIWISGADQRSYWFNRPWLTFTGRTLQEESGQGWIEGVHPSDRDACVQRYDQAFAQRDTFTMEFRLRGQDGQYRWVLNTGVPRFAAEGEFIGYIGSVIDIHDRKQAEQERDELLESERAARSDAERASRMKDEFLATLSHELRTPLNAVLGYAQLLRRVNVEPEVLQQGLETIERSAKAQAQLISDMLDVSRIISGKIRLDVQPTHLGPVIETAIDTIRPAAAGKQIEIVRDLPSDIPAVAGDPERLQQVLWNLISNAVKFTFPGGVVRVTVRRVGTTLEVSVADTGQGIAQEFLPYVFERFRQADGSSTRRHGGLGLGLSIVKNLTELHGGTVRATSEGEGKGATFIVSLPIAPTYVAPRRREDGDGRKSQEEPQLPNLKGVRVLAVDDEPDALHLLQRLLEPFDCEVQTAASAAAALEIIASAPPDVLVSDIGMPLEDGYSLIRKVRQLAPLHGGSVPAIALTAFARPEDRIRALRAGYQAHIPKPIEAPELLSAIAHLAKPGDGSHDS